MSTSRKSCKKTGTIPSHLCSTAALKRNQKEGNKKKEKSNSSSDADDEQKREQKFQIIIS